MYNIKRKWEYKIIWGEIKTEWEKKECIVYAFKPWEDLKKNQRADPVNM